MKSKWTEEDVLVQIDRALEGERAGYGDVEIQIQNGTVLISNQNDNSVVQLFIKSVVEQGFSLFRTYREMETDLITSDYEYRIGEGYGTGFGSGTDFGSGNGNGCGSGCGYGDGDGDGYGAGRGFGYGIGNGRGRGNGYGFGSGSGYGHGNGLGDGYETKRKFNKGTKNMSNISKNKPKLIRHDTAGVYLGYYQGEGELLGTFTMWCRHIWEWKQRLDTTAIATIGPGEGSSVGPWILIDLPYEGLVASIVATEKSLQNLETIPESLLHRNTD